jgi:superfamily II DNA/RNA helicase
MEAALKGRKKLNLKGLKCLVVDEADVFFIDEKNFNSLKAIGNYEDIKKREEGNKVQWILFSATYPDDDGTGIYDLV